MCGISGYIGRIVNPSQVLSQMNNQQSHRGPDNSSFVLNSLYGIGHCRLSIIDLSTASNQPLHNANFILAFNGEIYNWKELRYEFGLPSSTVKSDTQLLFALLAKVGIRKTIPHLRGIFAFVLVDKLDKKIHLVRDRFGTKPLYTYKTNETLYFASEIKAFTSLEDWVPSLDVMALQSYLTFQNNFNNKTLFKNVELIPAGTCFSISCENINKKEIFNLYNKTNEDKTLTPSFDTVHELEFLLKQAVTRNLVADVDSGAFLSGGIDSALISHFASEQRDNFKTFTIGFDLEGTELHEKQFDETDVAFELSQQLGAINYNHKLLSSSMDDVIDVVSYAIEDPRVGQSYPNFFASSLASKFAKVCLSGTGGDEIFGGYPWRYWPILVENSPDTQRKVMFNFWHRLNSPQIMAQILGLSLSDHLDKHIHEFNSALNQHLPDRDSPISLKSIMKFEQNTFLHGLLLIEDKLSMHHSLEVRVPYLDEDLVNFASSLPESLLLDPNIDNFRDINLTKPKIQNEQLRKSGKIALRKIAEKRTPKIANSSKQGFTAPDGSWFRLDRGSLIQSRLLDEGSVLWNWLDFNFTKLEIQKHLNGETNNRLLIWSLLTLESTLRQFKMF